MIFLVFSSLFLLTLTLIYIYLKQCLKISKIDLPGQKPQILFGNLFNSGLLTNKYTFNEIFHKYQQQYGDKFVFWYGSQPCITFCLPEHIQMIFSDRQKFEQSTLFLPNFDLICPASITMLSGMRWKRHARIMIPTFKRTKMIQHLNTIIECADRFIDQYLVDNQIHTNLVNHCQTLTMNIIGLIGFDYDLENHTDTSSKMPFQDFVSEATFFMLLAIFPRWIGKLYLKFNWKFQRIYQKIRQLTENIVQQEQANRDTTEEQRPKNLIASLVASLNEQANDEQVSSGLTSSEIFDEVITAMIAGYETTSAALSWFIFYMSKYPHIQQRMKDELREHDLLVTEDVQYLPPITPEKLDALTYCECVTKEVLRLAPVASATTRVALCDTTVDNIPIRQGQILLIAINNANTDARYWHYGDPLKFQPERFLNEDKNHHSYAMIPFGGGHRACLGQELAWLELKTIIVRLMQRGITFEDTKENIGGCEDRLACFPKQMAVRVHINQYHYSKNVIFKE